MALAASAPLSDIRQSVAVRLNMGAQAARSTRMHGILDEFIRSAQALLLSEFPWIVLDVEKTIDSIEDQHDYEVPDGMAVGDIHEITVLSKANREFPLRAGVAPHERNAFRIDVPGAGARSGLPLRYEVLDASLAIFPAPDPVEYPKIVIRGKATPSLLRNDNDLCAIDPQALITQAVIAGKEHFGVAGAQIDAQMQARYLRNLAAKQSDGELISVGPVRSRRYRARNSREGTGSDRRRFWPDYDPEYGIW